MDEQVSEISRFLTRMRDVAEEALGKRHPIAASGAADPMPARARPVAAVSPALRPSPLMTVEECAALLRTTPKAIYNRHSRGLLRGAVKDGDRLLIRRDDLLDSLVEVRGLPSSTEGKP